MADTLNPRSLLQGLQRDDPRLYEAFNYIFNNLDKINTELFPAIANLSAQFSPVTPSNVDTFTYTLLLRAIQFDWSNTANALQYEIRRATNGTVWETADFILRTTSISAQIIPPTAGTYTYLIKAISNSGTYSVLAKSLEITLVAPSVVDITPVVIDNNVLLTWNDPVHPFEIIHFHIYRQGVEIGMVNSNFFVYFEQLSGTYEYGVQAHDYPGNHGAITTVELQVSQPPDYVLEDSFTSTFTGTKVNCISEGGKLVAIVDTSKTWAQHFSDNSWATIQDQINAGYPIYIEPGLTTGSYEEIHDFSTIFSSVIISVNWNELVIDGDVQVVCKIAVSDDNITYSAYTSATTLFAESVRYVKFKLEFTSANDKGISEFSALTVFLNVKREMDGGTVDVLAADTGGTEVFFNKSFKDIESITLTPLSTTEQIAIYDFTDIPNPTSFFILLFDDTGVRIDGTVSWKARGIV